MISVGAKTVIEVSWNGGVWSQQTCDVDQVSQDGPYGRLIVFVSAEGPDSDHLIKSIHDYLNQILASQGSRSETAALSQAIKAVAAGLYEDNQQSAPEERHYASIACALLRGDDACFALTGPATAFLLHVGGVEEIMPAGLGTGLRPVPTTVHTGDTLNGADKARRLRLGDSSDPRVDLIHRRLKPGEKAILADPAFGEIAPAPLLGALSAALDAEALAASIRNLVRINPACPEFRGLLIDPELAGLTLKSPSALQGKVAREPATPNIQTIISQLQHQLPIQGADFARFETSLRALFRLLLRRLAKTPPRLRLGMLVIVAFVIGFMVVYSQVRAMQEAQALAEVTQIRNQLSLLEEQARSIDDPGERRQVLLQAGALSDSLSRFENQNSEIAESARRIRSRLDSIAGVTRPGQAPIVVSVDGRPDRMVLAGIDLYLLDQAKGLVHKFLLTPDGSHTQPTSNSVLLRRGDIFDGHLVGDLTGMLWMPAGSIRPNGGLLALESSGKMLYYQPAAGIKVLEGPGADTRVRLSSLSGFAGAIYGFDSASRQVVWIAPTNAGYTRQPYRYFEAGVQVDLSDVVDLAMDGELYLLHSTGKIDRYYAGKPMPFNATVPNKPLVRPTQMLVTKNAIYVLDPGSARVVQFNREGEFQRQIHLDDGEPSLRAARQIAVDENGGRLYILNGSNVHVLPLAGR